MNRRRCAAAATTLVCALAVLASPDLLNRAYAAPVPPPAASPSASPSAVAPPPVELPPGTTASDIANAGAGSGSGADSADSARSLEKVRLEIARLYRKAASATDAYNLADEQVKQQASEVADLAGDIVRGQQRIEALKAQAGAAARAQYRGAGLPPEARLLLAGDPQLFLDGVGRIKQGQKATSDLLVELTREQEDLKTYAADSHTHWDRLKKTRDRKEKAEKEIKKQISAAKKLEKSLAKKDRERLAALDRAEAARAQTAWLGSESTFRARGIGLGATAQGAKAVEFATAQIGKPYVWGGAGPSSYDCSGLTSQAWLAAGRPIPRTSQEQWRQLPKVAVADMRPGDLIIYFADASHVAMYVGDGRMVHAPRPGRDITLAGAGSMRILGVVRPDA
ncbi:C40 family peptidase [Streptomyces paludis]|uniref:NlpC/P60 family protein n=1 Tax=Streptomyces paludis TaxID=2282738 RepID=A0A345HRN0_9ACTN|nr:NlpC/P60 family protein [Streptomyces paludis]AXG79354.1 NlpC/P60 family protein [Streptomyces paludis]